jgi:hypothetical protein
MPGKLLTKLTTFLVSTSIAGEINMLSHSSSSSYSESSDESSLIDTGNAANIILQA